MKPRTVDYWLDPSRRLYSDSAKAAHLRAAKQATIAGLKLTWCGQPAPTIFPPWYAIGGQSRYAIAKQEIK